MKRKDNKQLRKPNTPYYKYWQAFYKALYSQALYVDVATRWRGFGIKYLFCLLMIATIPLSAKIMLNIYHYIDDSIIYPIRSLPTLQIDNGSVLTDKSLPYFIKDRHNEVVAMVTRFDNMENLLMYYPNLTVLVTMDKLYFKPPKIPDLLVSTSNQKSSSIYEKSFQYIAHDIFHGDEWVKSFKVRSFMWIMVLSIYPITISFFFGLFSSAMLLLSLLGQISAQIILHYKLKYKQTCRLIAVCSTLPLYIFFIIVAQMNPSKINTSISILVILAIYFYAAVFAVKHATQKIARI